MTNYLEKLIKDFPIRRSTEQKTLFMEYVKKEVKNYNVECVTLEKKHTNIIIGDVEKADVVFTAHYDTPGRSLFPNLMMPKNYILALLYGLGIPVIIALFSLICAYSIRDLFGFELPLMVFLYLLIYFGAFYLFTRAYTNVNNSNDNTSGVSTILGLTEKGYKNVAFILFDNEEKGLLGSKAYKKANKDMINKKLLINLDCVGNGNNVIVTAKKATRNLESYNILKQKFNSDDNYSVVFTNMEKTRSNSDHKNFDLSIGIMACKKSKFGIYYTDRIHTHQDTLVDFNNIAFITKNLCSFIDVL